MMVAQEIKRHIKTRNGELTLEAIIGAALGVVFSILTFGGLFWFIWLSGFLCLGSFNSSQATLVAGLVTAVFVLISFLSAWRHVDPTENLMPMSEREQATFVTKQMIGYQLGIPVINRHGLAGIAMMLIAGPSNLIEAWGIWRHRLPSSTPLVNSAADLLKQCERGVDMNAVTDHRALYLLHRLMLIRTEATGIATFRLLPTEKGRDALTAVH